jgi:hypothetical protein
VSEYESSELLSRLRADWEGIMEPRQLVAESRIVPPAIVTSRYEDTSGTMEGFFFEGDVPDQVGLQLPSEHVAAEDIGIVREIRARVERVDAKLSSLQAVVAETRAWTERVEFAHQAQQSKEAEERAARIVAEAEERARHLLAAAERAAADVTTVSPDRVSTPEPEVPEPEVPKVQKVQELSVDAAEAEALYNAIELFTRTNADVVNELSALLKSLPTREQRPEEA